MVIKRSATVLKPQSEVDRNLAARQLEQMLDLGDARMEPLGTDETYNHKVITLIGSEYFVWAEEVSEDVEPAGGDHPRDIHHCGVRPGYSGVDRSLQAVVTRAASAFALLKEALDWIGIVNPTEREEALAHHLQRRIARLLSEARE